MLLGSVKFQEEARMRKLDGTYRWILFTVTPLDLERGMNKLEESKAKEARKKEERKYK